MTLQEFAALAPGDKIINPMTQSNGVVTETTDQGVRVQWGKGTPGHDVTFLFSVQSNAWKHWSKIDDTV